MGNQRGFSLIESLVSLLILQFALLAIAPMFVLATRSTASAATMGQVGSAAVARFEQLRGAPFNDATLTAGSHTDNSLADATVTWTVVDESNYYKRITVTAVARKTPAGRTKRVDLYGVRGK